MSRTIVIDGYRCEIIREEPLYDLTEVTYRSADGIATKWVDPADIIEDGEPRLPSKNA